MKRILHILLYINIIASISLVSCNEQINWDVKNQQSMLVVEGEISTEIKTHIIKLSKSLELYDENSKTMVSGASVNVTDGINTYNFIESSGQIGIYESVIPFAALPGTEYILNIDLLESINNTLHYDASDIMDYPYEIEETNTSVEVVNSDFYQDSIYHMITYLYGAQSMQADKYYIVDLFKKDSLITDSLSGMILINPKEWGVENENYIPFSYSKNVKKFINDTLEFKLKTISQKYYSFLREVEISDIVGDPLGLDGPPSNIKGNISNGALGFFSATAVETGQFYVQKEEEIK